MQVKVIGSGGTHAGGGDRQWLGALKQAGVIGSEGDRQWGHSCSRWE